MDSIVSRACLQICEIVIFAPRKHPFDTLGYSPQDADYIQDNIPFIRPPPICIHRPRADPELNTLQKYSVSQMYCAPICIHRHRTDPEPSAFKIQNILRITKYILHQYVFTGPERN